MTAAEIQEFKNRDWRLLERSKSDYWVRQKATMTPAAVLELSGELFEYARAMKPDWPNSAEREADFASHLRVASKLRAAKDRAS